MRSAASDWLGARAAAKVFKAAETTLRESVAADVRCAYGYGIEITRARNGALRIKETKTCS